MKNIAQYIPALHWLKGYNRDQLIPDLIAAAIVTVLLIPQSLAYALLAGVPPEVGLYASILPLVAYALFGTRRTLSVGPVAIISLMTATSLGSVASEGSADYLTAATTLEGARALIDDLREITRSLVEGRGTLGRLLTDDALYQRMIATTEALGITLREINQADGTLARLIHDPALYDEIHGTIARIDSLGLAILSGEGTLGLLIQDDAAYQALLGAIGRADSTILSFGGALSGLTDGEGTIQRFLTDPALYDEFLRAVIELQTLIQDMRENPRKYRPEVKVDVF